MELEQTKAENEVKLRISREHVNHEIMKNLNK